MKSAYLSLVGIFAATTSIAIGPPAGQTATGPVGSTANRPPLNSSLVETTTPGFFDAAQPAPLPAAGDRAKGDEAEYNTEQYKEWTEKCAPLKKKSMELYRGCFQEELANMKRGLKKNREDRYQNRASDQTPTDQLWEKRSPSDDDFDE